MNVEVDILTNISLLAVLYSATILNYEYIFI